jgi:hypothetical protein
VKDNMQQKKKEENKHGIDSRTKEQNKKRDDRS